MLGLRDERGAVHIASARADRFISDAWARRSGQDGARKWTVSAEEEATGLGCQTAGLCRWRKGPWRIAMVSDERRLAEACNAADIVLSTVDAQGANAAAPVWSSTAAMPGASARRRYGSMKVAFAGRPPM